jgi:hypothetical protein
VWANVTTSFSCCRQIPFADQFCHLPQRSRWGDHDQDIALSTFHLHRNEVLVITAQLPQTLPNPHSHVRWRSARHNKFATRQISTFQKGIPMNSHPLSLPDIIMLSHELGGESKPFPWSTTGLQKLPLMPLHRSPLWARKHGKQIHTNADRQHGNHGYGNPLPHNTSLSVAKNPIHHRCPFLFDILPPRLVRPAKHEPNSASGHRAHPYSIAFSHNTFLGAFTADSEFPLCAPLRFLRQGFSPRLPSVVSCKKTRGFAS